MLPEAGDKSTEVRCEDVTAGARAAGIVPGDVLMFHSSLSSMGHVTGGPESVIDGLLDAVGPEGTVAVPTLCNWQPGEEALVFSRVDSCMAPSYVGILTETLRLRPSALRSNHPTHSIAGSVRAAEELTRDRRRRDCAWAPSGTVLAEKPVGETAAVECGLLLHRCDLPGQHDGALPGEPYRRAGFAAGSSGETRSAR